MPLLGCFKQKPNENQPCFGGGGPLGGKTYPSPCGLLLRNTNHLRLLLIARKADSSQRACARCSRHSLCRWPRCRCCSCIRSACRRRRSCGILRHDPKGSSRHAAYYRGCSENQGSLISEQGKCVGHDPKRSSTLNVKECLEACRRFVPNLADK